MNNLDVSLTDEEFKDAFKRFGEIMTCNIVKDKINNQSKEIGFIKFEEKESADKAVMEMNETVLNNKKIKVEISKKGGPRNQTPGKYFGPRDGRDPRDFRDRFF